MKTVVAAIAVLVLLGVVGYGAYTYGESVGLTQAQNIRTEFFANRQGASNGPTDTGQGGARGGAANARAAATGTVKTIQGNTLTVSQRDGSTVTVTLDAQTVIQKTSPGTAGDIQPGMNITVMSSQTGSNIAAQVIQLRPSGQQ